MSLMVCILFPITITQRKFCQKSIISFSDFQNVLLHQAEMNMLFPPGNNKSQGNNVENKSPKTTRNSRCLSLKNYIMRILMKSVHNLIRKIITKTSKRNHILPIHRYAYNVNCKPQKRSPSKQRQTQI